MTAPLSLDDLLRQAGRHHEGAPAVDAWLEHPQPPSASWQELELYLQTAAQARRQGQDLPEPPIALLAACESDAVLRRAFTALLPVTTAALADRLQTATELPASLRTAIQGAAEADARRTRGAAEVSPAAAANASSGAPSLASAAGDVLRATVRFVVTSWQAVETFGLSVVQAEMILARGAGNGPVAMQGLLGGRYLVAFALSGDPTRSVSALDAQCQEVQPGAATPRPIPSFCLRDESGRRYHSRDRIARVEPISLGEHVFTLEVLGRPKGTIVLDLRG